MNYSIAFVAAAALVLGACGGPDENSGGLSGEENRKLDNIAETLDASPDSLSATEETGLGNGEEASAEAGDLPVTDEAATNGADDAVGPTNSQ